MGRNKKDDVERMEEMTIPDLIGRLEDIVSDENYKYHVKAVIVNGDNIEIKLLSDRLAEQERKRNEIEDSK